MRKAFLIIFLFIVSCKGNKIPDGVLPPEKMETVLIDVLLAESFAESYKTIDSSRTLKGWYAHELDRVLAVHHITEKQLMASVDYYKTQPEVFKVIMDTVNNRAQRQKDRVFNDAMKHNSK